MRAPRKRPAGWRTLRIGDVDLWWTVGEPRVTARLPTEAGEALTQAITITLTVERADGSGKKLVATIRGHRALAVPSAGFRDVQTIAVEPASVRRLVELAAPRGAWPTGTGTWKTELELVTRPLPTELAFRPEHLDDLTLIWRT
ncbi:MAG: hypothetical protein NT062_20140 [Proteobacteria bacterium]|nr:hypothetical protein [Pseudomonadota bacterium]